MNRILAINLMLVVNLFGSRQIRVGAADVDFLRDVRPILEQRCYDCHGPTKQKSGLRLDIRSSAFTGGAAWGPSLVAGQASESPLIQMVTSTDPSERMPPESEPLSIKEIDTLVRWVTAGAVWPEEADQATLSDKRDHWSFKPLVEFGEHASQSIDQFIDARLAERGLIRNPIADPRTLARRIYFDLTGLPPTPDEVDAFVRQPNTAQLVEQLLASPRYGERWAQHWLDVIRWAETVGFETNAERQFAWPYRDWVIDSLNADKPYDRFLFEQIAGDTVGEDAALGFLVAGPANLPGQIGRDEVAMRGARQDELDEVISTVSQACLGLTVGCARCHDHKFDPILQKDYYSMQAIFAGLSYGTRRWRGPENDAWTLQVPAVRDELNALRNKLQALREKNKLREALADVHAESFAPVMANAIRMRIHATNNGTPASLYEFEVWGQAHGIIGEPSNVALASNGAMGSASSFALANQTRHFDNLIDGSVDQRQAYPWVAAKSGPAWFQVDFKMPTVIDRIVFHRGTSMPTNFTIEVLDSTSDTSTSESSLSDGAKSDEESKPQWREIAHARDRLPREDDNRKWEELEIANLSVEATQAVWGLLKSTRAAKTKLAQLSAGPQVYAASFSSEPTETYLLRRGDAMQRSEQVTPAIPEYLGILKLPPGASEADGRVALARYLAAADNPLVARVMVNRVWHYHFGKGLVDTPSDFGLMGTKPSHPELLDWLAAKFIAEGWSLKNLHRLILNSETYCQSSSPQSEALLVDAECRLLWRFPPRRLEAEAIRDSILSVSGKLNLKMGGAGFDFFNQRGGLADYQPKLTFQDDGFRRMIYAHKVRMISVDILGAFDCPDAGQMKPSRTQSITPIQALGLFNSPFVNHQAALWAERIRSEVGGDLATQVDRAVALAYSRRPTAHERQRLVSLARDHGLEQVCRVIFNTSEFAFIQ